MKTRIYLSPPHLSGSEQQYVAEALNSNWLAQSGHNIKEFEEELARYSGSSYCIALITGTAAIHLSLILSDVKQGDLVICQSFTFSATANPIAYLGALPIFIDSEPGTWNMDPVALEEAIINCLNGKINGKLTVPKAIIPVHLFGMPASMQKILAIADEYNIPVIEDAAEALGSSFNGKKCGTLGKSGILSFNGNKVITSGGGGALLSEDAGLIERARFLAAQARDKAPHYQHSQIGYNYLMGNIVAGVGRAQLKVVNERIAARQANFERYRQYFKSIEKRGYKIEFQGEGLNIPIPDEHAINHREEYSSNRWLTAIIIDPAKNNGITCEDLRLAFETANIECRPLWKPMHLQPVFADCPFFSSRLLSPDARFNVTPTNYYEKSQDKISSYSGWLFENGLCLPSGSSLNEENWDRIIQTLEAVFI